MVDEWALETIVDRRELVNNIAMTLWLLWASKRVSTVNLTTSVNIITNVFPMKPLFQLPAIDFHRWCWLSYLFDYLRQQLFRLSLTLVVMATGKQDSFEVKDNYLKVCSGSLSLASLLQYRSRSYIIPWRYPMHNSNFEGSFLSKNLWRHLDRLQKPWRRWWRRRQWRKQSLRSLDHSPKNILTNNSWN